VRGGERPTGGLPTTMSWESVRRRGRREEAEPLVWGDGPDVARTGGGPLSRDLLGE
jgi:hypothetical protein